MARRKLIAESQETSISKQTQLSKLVESYGGNKSQFDSLKKECDAQNAQIKELMADLNCTEYESGGYLAKYSVQHRASMNEDRLLELLSSKCYDLCKDLDIIKSREYVDSDALESAIYSGKLPQETILAMDTCKETKDVPTLKISKLKED